MFLGWAGLAKVVLETEATWEVQLPTSFAQKPECCSLVDSQREASRKVLGSQTHHRAPFLPDRVELWGYAPGGGLRPKNGFPHFQMGTATGNRDRRILAFFPFRSPDGERLTVWKKKYWDHRAPSGACAENTAHLRAGTPAGPYARRSTVRQCLQGRRPPQVKKFLVVHWWRPIARRQPVFQPKVSPP